MTLEVVKFPVQVSLADIPGRLRQLADEIEEQGDDRPLTLIHVEGYEDGSVNVGCFGDNPSKWELVGLLTLGANKFTADPGQTRRRGGG